MIPGATGSRKIARGCPPCGRPEVHIEKPQDPEILRFLLVEVTGLEPVAS